jgi:hypothetical protein
MNRFLNSLQCYPRPPPFVCSLLIFSESLLLSCEIPSGALQEREREEAEYGKGADEEAGRSSEELDPLTFHTLNFSDFGSLIVGPTCGRPYLSVTQSQATLSQRSPFHLAKREYLANDKLSEVQRQPRWWSRHSVAASSFHSVQNITGAAIWLPSASSSDCRLGR